MKTKLFFVNICILLIIIISNINVLAKKHLTKYLYLNYNFTINITTFNDVKKILDNQNLNYYVSTNTHLDLIKQTVSFKNSYKEYLLIFGKNNRLKSIVIALPRKKGLFDLLKKQIAQKYPVIKRVKNKQIVKQLTIFYISKKTVLMLEDDNYSKKKIYLRYINSNFFKQLINEFKGKLKKLINQNQNFY